ncbi:MAG: hypothetical protein SVY41_01590 [Candidatus Nanohaloarchaea archaeon]|nr:hypothetical protein [Candidatus Nanohaloarchaea archaeon]
MSFDADPLETGDPLEEQGIEEEAETVLSDLDGLGPHPTSAHRLQARQEGETVDVPAATYEEILDDTGVDGDTLIDVLNTLHRIGEVYRPRDDQYAITTPSERLPEPDIDYGINIVRFES